MPVVQQNLVSFEDFMLEVKTFSARHNASEDLILEVLFRHMYERMKKTDNYFVFTPIKYRIPNFGITPSEQEGYSKISFLDDSPSHQDIFGFSPPEMTADTLKTMLTIFVMDHENPEFKYNFIASNKFDEDQNDSDPSDSENENQDVDLEQTAELDLQNALEKHGPFSQKNFNTFKKKHNSLFFALNKLDQHFSDESLKELLKSYGFEFDEIDGESTFSIDDIPAIARIIFQDHQAKSQFIVDEYFTEKFIRQAIEDVVEDQQIKATCLTYAVNFAYTRKAMVPLLLSEDVSEQRLIFSKYGDGCEISNAILSDFLKSEAANQMAATILQETICAQAYSLDLPQLCSGADSLGDFGVSLRTQFQKLLKALNEIVAPYKLHTHRSDIFEFSLAKMYGSQLPTQKCQFSIGKYKMYALAKNYILVITGLDASDTQQLVANINSIKSDSALFTRIDGYAAMNLSYNFITTDFLPKFADFLQQEPSFIAMMQDLYKNAIADSPEAPFYNYYYPDLEIEETQTISSSPASCKKLRTNSSSEQEEADEELYEQEELDVQPSSPVLLFAKQNSNSYWPSRTTVLSVSVACLGLAAVCAPKFNQ